MTFVNVFLTILKMSFFGTVAAAIILLIKKVFNNKISAACHYWIWMILLLRLMIPYYPESSVSVYNFFAHHNYKTEEIQSPVINDMRHNYTNGNEIQPEMNSGDLHADFSQMGDEKQAVINKKKPSGLNLLQNQRIYTFSTYADDSNKGKFEIPYIASLIWLLGTCLGGIFFLWLQVSYSMKIKRFPLCDDRNIAAIYENCKSRMKVKKKISLVMDTAIQTPSLIGIFYPKIILSPSYTELLTEDELKFVFMHELAHYKRKDIIFRWLLIFLQILHWFNPVIWVVFNRIRQDSEKACDAQVLSYIESKEYKMYGNTMLKMLDIFSGQHSLCGVVGMMGEKKFIVERVRNIVNFKKNYVLWSVAGVIIFSVLAVFLLTNARQPAQEVIKIKYEAEKIIPNSEVGVLGRMKLLSNGQLLTYDMQNRQLITIDDEGNKKEIHCEGLPQDFRLQLFTADAKDAIYIFDGSARPKIYVFSLEGKKIKEMQVELKDVDPSEMHAVLQWDMKVDSKGNIYLLIPQLQTQQASTQIFDSEGKHIKTLKSDGYTCIELDAEDNLYTIAWENRIVITKQNPLTGEILWQYKDEGNLSYVRTVAYSKQDQSLYLVELNGNRVSKFDLQNQSLNKMMNMDALLIDESLDSFYLQDCVVGGDESIYLQAYNMKDSKSNLYKIHSKKVHVEEGVKTLTISVRYLSPVLEYAINKFENQHPDIVINIENHNAFSWTTSDMNYEEILQASKESEQKEYDFVQKMNAQMLTGKGPDILLIDSIPYRKYADKNLLVDLKELIKKDSSFDKSQYYANIFDALTYKDKLYAMPLDFSYSAFVTNTGFLKEQSIEINDRSWTWKDFIDIASKATKDMDGDGKPDMYGMPTVAPESLFMDLYRGSGEGFVDYETQKAYFTSGEFIDLLKMCKSISQGDFVNPDVSEANSGQGGIAFYPFLISDFSIFYSNGLINADEVSFYRYPAGNQTTYNFSAGEMYGINSRTKHQKEAWEFIKYLLSEEVQSYEKLYGIPVNKKAREMKIKNHFSTAEKAIEEHGDLYGYQVVSADGIKKQLKENMEKLDKILPELNHCSTNDIQIDQIVVEEAGRFFKDEQSAEEAAEMIQRKVEMHFKE